MRFPRFAFFFAASLTVVTACNDELDPITSSQTGAGAAGGSSPNAQGGSSSITGGNGGAATGGVVGSVGLGGASGTGGVVGSVGLGGASGSTGSSGKSGGSGVGGVSGSGGASAGHAGIGGASAGHAGTGGSSGTTSVGGQGGTVATAGQAGVSGAAGQTDVGGAGGESAGAGGAQSGSGGAPSLCNPIVEEHPEEGFDHEAICSVVTYATNPPSSGNHYGVWTLYQTYTEPVPRGFYVHNMEHGAVVFTYNCPQGCDDQIAAAQAILDAHQDPLCTSPGDARARVLMTPDPLLDVTFAASSWLWTLRADCFDPDAFSAFLEAHFGQGREPLCNEGTDIFGTGLVTPGCGM